MAVPNKKVLMEEDFDFPTEKSIRAELERELRWIAAQEGLPRVAEIEAARRAKLSHIPLRPLSAPDHTEDRKVEAPSVAPVPQKPQRSKREKKEKVPEGMIHIGVLAKEWGIGAVEARSLLRASSLKKPPYGWYFSKKEIPQVKKICGVKA